MIGLGVLITQYVRKSFKLQGKKLTKNDKEKLVKLWIMISTNTIDAFLQVVIETLFITTHPDECYKVTPYDYINAVIWIVFRLTAVNLWIWPCLYVFNAKKIYKEELLSIKKNEEDSYDQFESFATENKEEPLYPNINSNMSNNESSDVTTNQSSADQIGSLSKFQNKIVFSKLSSGQI